MDTFKITFNYDSAHALPHGVMQDNLYDSPELLSTCKYNIYSLLKYMDTFKITFNHDSAHALHNGVS